MNKIKNIIFDLGGVVIDLDRLQAIHALEELGISDASHILGEYEQKGPFLELEKGLKSDSEVYDILLEKCKPGTTTTNIRDAFESFLLGLPKERLAMIRALRDKGYKLYVLSNTNPIMYNHWIDEAFRAEGLSINDYFDGIVASFQERTCKPDPAIFRRVTDRYHLEPSETLMIDDSVANCQAARSIGLNAIEVKKNGEECFTSICNRLLEEADHRD